MATSLAKLRKEIKNNKLDAILISSVPNIIYLTNYSGFSKEEREAYLFITKNEQHILPDGRYTTAVKALIPDFKLIEISPKNPANELLKKIKVKYRIKKLGIEENNLTYKEYKEISSCFDDLNHFSLTNLRTIKDEKEISKIEKACRLGDETFNYILKKIRLGVSEKDVANKIEFFIKKNGGDLSFPTIVAFGKNSAIPHHQASDQRLTTKDQVILLDFGVKLDNYCSDMTRTIFFGSANAEFKKMYNTVLKTQTKAIEMLNTKYLIHNTKASSIDKVARDYIISKGYPSIPHSLGHGVGIEVHENPHLSPKSKDILKEGMVFSIEPGIYLPNSGGVRIEDLVVLEKKGPRLLTHSLRNLIEL